MGYINCMKDQFIKINNLSVAKQLADFVNNELLKDTEISTERFWLGLDISFNERVTKLIQICTTCNTKLSKIQKFVL